MVVEDRDDEAGLGGKFCRLSKLTVECPDMASLFCMFAGHFSCYMARSKAVLVMAAIGQE